MGRALGRSRSASGVIRLSGLSQRSLASIFNHCVLDESRAGFRDAALLGLMAGAGLSPSEVIALEWRDVEIDRGVLTISGRSRFGRAVALQETTLSQLLRRWSDVALRRDGSVLTSTSEPSSGQPLSRAAVYRIVSRRARAAGFSGLLPSDLAHHYWWDLKRQHASGRTSCSLVTSEDGVVQFLSPALDIRVEFASRPEEAELAFVMDG